MNISPPSFITVEGKEYVLLSTFLGMAGGFSRQRFWELQELGRGVPELLRLGRNRTLVPLIEGRAWIVARETRKALAAAYAQAPSNRELRA